MTAYGFRCNYKSVAIYNTDYDPDNHFRGVTKMVRPASGAERFNVAQPRISEIYQGKIELFSADKLINMLARVGQHVEISINEAA